MGKRVAPTRFVKPTVMVSKCLGTEVCRYDGQRLGNDFVRDLKRWAKLIPVCPEMEIGLGVPRDKIILAGDPNRPTLHQPATGRRLGRTMSAFAKRCLGDLEPLDGAILKSKSPSCGLNTTKVFAGATGEGRPVGKGSGLFAAGVVGTFPTLPLTDEQKLADMRFRERWLVRLFTRADFRHLGDSPTQKQIIQCHERHRMLLQTISKRQVHEMDLLLTSGDSGQALGDHYLRQLHTLLMQTPRRRAELAACEEASRQYAPHLRASEKKRFEGLLCDLADGSILLHSVRKAVQVWAVRYDKSYVRSHSFFRPFPGELCDG